MELRQVFISAVLVTASLPAGIGSNEPNAVTVYEVGPGWTLGGKAVIRGQLLSAVAELVGSEGESSNLVLNCGKEGLIGYKCERQPCHVPVCSTKVEGAVVSALPASNWFRTATDPYLKRDPKPLAILGVRAGGSLSDAVVRKADNDVHWAPVFRRVVEGTYCLRVGALPAAASKPRAISINWDRSVDAEGTLPVPDLQPGLYSVEKGSPDAGGQCVIDPDLPAVWVLVVAGANFDRVDRAWKEASAQFNDLQSAGASPFVLATFRHAALSYLADSAEAKPPA